MIRVAILANGMAMRIGLQQLISNLPDVEIVADGIHSPNLFTADIWVLTSVELLPRNGENHPALLLLSDNPTDASQLINFPLWGILPLETGDTGLDAAIRALAEGLCIGTPSLLGDVISLRQPLEVEPADITAQPLTGRELEVLQSAAEGMANKQIALSLGISEHTVKFHLSSIYTKLGVTSRTEAIRTGARRGLVTL